MVSLFKEFVRIYIGKISISLRYAIINKYGQHPREGQFKKVLIANNVFRDHKEYKVKNSTVISKEEKVFVTCK